MPQLNPAAPDSPLLLCERLISLAQYADRTGFPATAEQLASLVERMFDEAPPPRRRPFSRRARPAAR